MGLISNVLKGVRLFPVNVLKKWALVTGTLSVILALLTTTWGGESVYQTFLIARYVGLLLGTGLPLVVGASFLICSEEVKQRIVETETQGESVGFGALFGGYLVLTLFFMTLVTLFKFCVTGVITGGLEILPFIPQMLLVTCLLTGLLSPIAVVLAVALDSPKINALAGLGVFCSLLLTTGQPGFPVNLPETAFFSPAHLLPALFFTVVFAPEYPYAADYYVGLYFTPVDLLLPLVVLTLVSALSYRASMGLFESNLKLWRTVSGQWLSGAKPSEDKQVPQRVDDTTEIMNSLRVRRRNIGTTVLLIVVLMPLTGISYVSLRQSEWTRVVYESPAGGEAIEIGAWYYNSFEGIEPAQNLYLSVGCEGEILEGGGPEANITLNFDSREMTLAELQELNETQLEDMFGRGWSCTSSNRVFSTGWHGPIHEAQYVWVLRFLNVGGQTEGMVLVRFQVMIAVV